MPKTLNEKMKKIQKDWRNKVIEAKENGEYLEPHPPEMRREFWKYGLNPITGAVPPSPITNQRRELDFNLPTSEK